MMQGIKAAWIGLALTLAGCGWVPEDKAYCERVGTNGAQIINARTGTVVLRMAEAKSFDGRVFTGDATDATGEKLATFSLHAFDGRCIIETFDHKSAKYVLKLPPK
jgi:hypothetical protein